MNRTGLLLITALLLLSACAQRKARKLAEPVKKDTVAVMAPNKSAVMDSLLKQQATRFKYLSVSGRADYQQGTNSQELSFTLRIREDSMIWISVTAMLGIEVARIKALKDTVYILDHLNRRLLIKDYSYLRQFTPLPLGYDQLQALLLGNRLFELSNHQEPRSLPDEPLVLYTSYDASTTYDMQIDANQRIVAAAVTENPTGRRVKIFNEQLQKQHEQWFPALLKLEVPDKQMTLSIQYEAPKFEQELRFPFNIPSKYEVVR